MSNTKLSDTHRIWDFHGGIHPPENKQQSLQHAIRPAPIPPELILPCSQHLGAPAEPVVTIGERVLKGQMLADAVGPVSVPVHASTSGVVTAIEDRPIAHASGMSDRCIVLRSDGDDAWIPHSPVAPDTIKDRTLLLQCIREAGIAGMGGAGFPSSIKLAAHPDKRIDTLIINGTECEPYITADHALMCERAEDVVAGIKVLAHLIQPKRVLIGIEDNKLDGAAAITNVLASAELLVSVDVVTFPTKYPSGGEKQLIEILTGLQVPSGGLPADIGIVCQNLGTTAAIHHAVHRGEPLISRLTTVTGNAVARPGNYDVLLGTPIEFLLEHAGLDEHALSRLIMGGPMMGFTLTDVAAPLVKSSNCIIAADAHELPAPPPPQACIRCGMCAEVCPASLLPQQLYWFSQGKELDKLEAHNIADCIECGACSYVCPSNIPLVQYYRASKAEIRQRKLDHKIAEQSKIRFEARQDRLQRLEDEKQAARKARQAAAKAAAANRPQTTTLDREKAGDADAKAAEVQAAIERIAAKKAASADESSIDDPIARAIARRQQQGVSTTANPQDKLTQAVTGAEKRLAKANGKLRDAQAANSPNVDALQSAVAICETKLEKARSALANHEKKSSDDHQDA